MSTTTKIFHPGARISRRQPNSARASSPSPISIEPAYIEEVWTAAPASALVAALASTATLFLAFGMLALPAAAFA